MYLVAQKSDKVYHNLISGDTVVTDNIALIRLWVLFPQSIENEGKYPSIELFIQLITMFDVSVDEYIFPNKEVKKSSVRRRLDAQLDNLDDKELSVIEATVNGLCKAKEPEE